MFHYQERTGRSNSQAPDFLHKLILCLLHSPQTLRLSSLCYSLNLLPFCGYQECTNIHPVARARNLRVISVSLVTAIQGGVKSFACLNTAWICPSLFILSDFQYQSLGGRRALLKLWEWGWGCQRVRLGRIISYLGAMTSLLIPHLD